jgi:hypothetical protein
MGCVDGSGRSFDPAIGVGAAIVPGTPAKQQLVAQPAPEFTLSFGEIDNFFRIHES